jgi:glycosyltransferase involved in cell wall biosynthesis
VKKVKKILFTSFDGIPNERQGGPNNIICKILNNLDQDKFEPTFLSYKNHIETFSDNPDKEIKPNLKKRATDFLYYNSTIYKKITTNRFYLHKHFKLRDAYFERYADKLEQDVIHSHDALSQYYFRNKKNSLKILTIHGNGSIENDWADAAKNNVFVRNYIPELKRREIEAFNNADIITFPGVYARDLYLSDYGNKLRTDKIIKIINNGINKEEIDDIKSDKGILASCGYTAGHDLVLINIAAHVRQKNIDIIISVIGELVRRGKNPLLINAGSGPLTEEIKAKIKVNNLAKNIKLVRKLEHRDILTLMKSSDALIMLSERVIFDLVMLEAVAAGIPIISDTSGGNSEILFGYKNLLDTGKKCAFEIADMIHRNFYAEKNFPAIYNAGFKYNLNSMSQEYNKLYEYKSG